jgi:hypothetical protein
LNYGFITSDEDVQKRRFLEIEDEKLALARETLKLKKRKIHTAFGGESFFLEKNCRSCRVNAAYFA